MTTTQPIPQIPFDAEYACLCRHPAAFLVGLAVVATAAVALFAIS